ncbi:MAG: polymer-forming cytoskeletal protein [bacterium]|nr:polymer-forming cytoskeletal protein [bacterium]
MFKRTLLLVALLLPFSASAVSLHVGDYFLKGAEETPDDLYTLGRTATFSGAVWGDATALGRTIFSESAISGDILFLGEEVRIEGPVGDDIRIVGERVTLNGTVADDVVVIGSRVVIGPKAEVKGSLYVIGGSVDIAGTVHGDVKVLSGALTLSGAIDGDVELWGKGTFVAPSRIGGDFIQHNEGILTPPVNVAITGKVILDAKKQNGSDFGTMFFGGLFSLRILMMLAFGFALFLLARERTEEVLLETLPNFWTRALRGLLIGIILPLVAVILLPTIIGIPLAFALMSLYSLLLLLSWGLAGILVGVWGERLFFKRSAFPLTYRPVLLGVLFLSVISAVPFFGGLFHGILMLSIAGSLGTLFMRFLRSRE